jgi:hypothetical protein
MSKRGVQSWFVQLVEVGANESLDFILRGAIFGIGRIAKNSNALKRLSAMSSSGPSPVCSHLQQGLGAVHRPRESVSVSEPRASRPGL